MTSAASLVLVPFLCKKLTLSDPSIVLLGSSSLILEYVCYGLVLSPSYWMFVWIGPAVGLLSNAAVIACRSMPTKLVTVVEKGKQFSLSAISQSYRYIFLY